MGKERMKYSTNMVGFPLAMEHTQINTGYVAFSWLLILLLNPSKIQVGIAPTSRNGSWEESKRGLLEESIVESIVEIE